MILTDQKIIITQEKDEKKVKKDKKEKKEKKRSREAIEEVTREEIPSANKESKKAKKEKKAKTKEEKKEKSDKGKKDAKKELESHPLVGDLNETQDGEEESGTAAKAFQRVKADDWIGKKGSWDNSYEGTFGQAGWGFKAQQILGKVRGKDFRHEKTKKKRGSYRGGLIDSNAVSSYKFDSDDD